MGEKTRADYRNLLGNLLQDNATKLSASARDDAINAAVTFHSRVKPDYRRRSITGNGSSTIGTPTSWHNDWSVIPSDGIEYPVNKVPPTYLEEDDWLLKESPTASTKYQIVFLGAQPGTGETFNLKWTVPHALGAGATASATIVTAHYRPVGMLAASFALEALAAFYTQSGDSTIAVDSMNPQTKEQGYDRLAMRWRKRYQEYFGLSDDQIAPASMWQDVDRLTSWRGDFFVHRKKWR